MKARIWNFGFDYNLFDFLEKIENFYKKMNNNFAKMDPTLIS